MVTAEERDGLVMERIRNQKWACLLLAAIVMISGICLERVPANAYFSCTKNSSVTRADMIYKEISVYREETFNQREVLNSLRLARRDVRRSQTRVATETLCLSNADIIPQNYQSASMPGEDRLYYETSCSLAILTYIHNQDGEKA